MLAELTHIRNALIRIVVAFVVLTIVFLTVPISYLNGTVTEKVIVLIQTQIIPAGATLAVMSPLDPFFAQASVAASLAVAFIIPLCLWELWHFAAPALTRRERRVFAGGLMSACILALLGAVFAYNILIPLMFSELFTFLPQGVVPLFNLRVVLSQVVSFTLGTALMFLLPLLMMLLSLTGLVPARVWANYARHAVLLVLVLSAIITPDGSGVGMTFLAVPVCALYGLGYAGARAVARKSSIHYT